MGIFLSVDKAKARARFPWGSTPDLAQATWEWPEQEWHAAGVRLRTGELGYHPAPNVTPFWVSSIS